MKNLIPYLIASGFLIGSAGCTVPLGNTDNQPRTAEKNRNARPTALRTASAASAKKPSASGAPLEKSQMRINADIVDASQMWSDLADELIEQTKDDSPEESRTYVTNRAAQWISDKATETLLYRKAKLRLPENSSERIEQFVDSEIRKIVTQKYGGIQRRLDKSLAKQKRSIDDLRESLRSEIIIAGFLDAELKPKIAEPTKAELREAFEENKESWHRPKRHRMSLIDLRILKRLADGVDNPTREDLANARKDCAIKIRAAQSEIREGTPFAQVAEKYSDGLHAVDGGDWGWVSPGGVRERYEPAVAALYQLKEGQVSDMIKTDDGFFLVRCDEVDAGFTPTFMSVQQELQERYYRNKYNTLVQKLVGDLRANADTQPPNLRLFHEAVVDNVLARLAEISS